jgi:hypothetical protein
LTRAYTAEHDKRSAIVVKSSGAAKSHWSIVVADDHGPDWATAAEGLPAPVQYCALENGITPLQRALHRAADIAPVSQVIVTAFEEYRERWEPTLWFVKPQHRFVCDTRRASSLSATAAILSVAARSPSDVITVLPARCYVAHEWILRSALHRAFAELPETREGILTLGMIDLEDGIDEDYLAVSRPSIGRGFQVDGFSRRPVPWVAAHLKREGALVASGIMVGYAGAFAAHISKTWPGLSSKLARLVCAASVVGAECEIPASLCQGVPPVVLHSLRWHPSALPQRALGVFRSGWSGLKSPRSVARMVEFLALHKRVATRAAIPLSHPDFLTTTIARRDDFAPLCL